MYIYIYTRDTCMHTYIVTYIHTHVHTYIHTHVHTYIHKYTCTYIFLSDTAEKCPHGEAVVTGSHPGYLEPCTYIHTYHTYIHTYISSSRAGV